MRLIRPLAMTNANIPRKKMKTIHKKIFKKYKYKLWYKNYKFLSFLNSFLKRTERSQKDQTFRPLKWKENA